MDQIPAIILAAEYILGGLVRASRIPFASAHERVIKKNASIAPLLYPIVPFEDVKNHNRYVGVWMIATGLLWANPESRLWLPTLGLSLFWTGAGWYSQARAGMSYWLPVTNFALSFVVYWLAHNRDIRGRRVWDNEGEF